MSTRHNLFFTLVNSRDFIVSPELTITVVRMEYNETVLITSEESIESNFQLIRRLYPLMVNYLYSFPEYQKYQDRTEYESKVKIGLLADKFGYHGKMLDSADEAMETLRVILVNAITQSNIHVKDGKFFVEFGFKKKRDAFFGRSNAYINGYDNWLVISDVTKINCIITSMYHGKIIEMYISKDFPKFGFDTYLEKENKLAENVYELKKRITKYLKKEGEKNEEEPDKFNFTCENDLPIIRDYFSNVSKEKILFQFFVYNERFKQVAHYDYNNVPNSQIKNFKRITLHFRKFQRHLMLMVPKKTGNSTYLPQEMQIHLECKFQSLHEMGEIEGVTVYKNERNKYIYQNKLFESENHLTSWVLLNEKKYPYTFGKNFLLVEKPKLEGTKVYQENVEKYNVDIVAYDIETFPGDNELQIPYAIGLARYSKDKEEVYKHFVEYPNSTISCIKQFFEYLADNKNIFNGKTFYAHNGGKFDAFILIREYLYSPQSLWLLKSDKFVYVSGAIISFSLMLKSDRSVKIAFKDSFRLMSDSLSNLTKDFKVKHVKKDFQDIGGITKDNYLDRLDEIIEYLEYDCFGLLEIIQQFRFDILEISNIDIMNFLTSSSVACGTFLKNFYKQSEYPLFQLPHMLDNIIRRFYFGGRVECFYLGEIKSEETGDIFMLDFNSLYPDVMLEKLPYGKPRVLTLKEMLKENLLKKNIQMYSRSFGETQIEDMEEKEYTEDIRITDEAFGFVWLSVRNSPLEYDSHVHIPGISREEMNERISKMERHFPRLHAFHDGKRLMFPDFEESTDIMVFSEELKLSYEFNLPYDYDIKGIIQFNSYEFLKDYIIKFYQQKKNASLNNESSKEKAFKDLLNTLYGTFGIKLSRECLSIIFEEDADFLENIWESGRLINIDYLKEGCDTKVIQFEDYINAKCCSTSVASAITSYARMKQWRFQYELMLEIPEARIACGDTDSTLFQLYCPIKSERKALFDKFIKSWVYKNYIVGGAEGILGKQKDEMRKPMKKKLGNDGYLKYLKNYGAYTEFDKKHDGYIEEKHHLTPITTAIIAGCKMYYIFCDVDGEIISKNALKGYKNAKDVKMTENVFKKLFSENGLTNEQTQWDRNKYEFSIHIHQIEKNFKTTYMKGDVYDISDKDDIYKVSEIDLEGFQEHGSMENLLQPNKKRKVGFSIENQYKIRPYWISKDQTQDDFRKFPEDHFKYYLENKDD